jgi:glycosyltransferase involved in cell wall biosynthesis
LPSRYEGLSITLIEALFAQIPILASHVGGNKEIVGKECVFKNEKEFLEKIKTPRLPKTKREIFELENMVKGYLKVYHLLQNL